MSILVSVPSYGAICAETELALSSLDACGHELVRRDVTRYDVTQARNRIGEACLEGGHSHVLMVDADVIPPADALASMLDPDAPVVFGLYPAKGRPDIRLHAWGNMTRRGFVGRVTMEHLLACDDRIQVAGCGFGCALVRRDVLERLPFPWFTWVMYGDGRDMSEDLSFCRLARDNGVLMYADKRVMCGHATLAHSVETLGVRYAR